MASGPVGWQAAVMSKVCEFASSLCCLWSYKNIYGCEYICTYICTYGNFNESVWRGLVCLNFVLVHVCIYICIYIRIYVYIRMYACIRISTKCVRRPRFFEFCAFTGACIYICIYICTYAYTCVYLHIK